MLGVVATERLPELLSAVHRGDAATVLAEIEAMAEYAPDFGGMLREVVTLLHRVALLQQVPDAAQPVWGDVERLQSLAAAIPAEDIQLYYQIALTGQRDLPLAPEERGGFEMVMLRMLAFRPADDAARPAGNDKPSKKTSERASAPGRPGRAAGPAGPPDASARTPLAETASDPFADWHAFVSGLPIKGMAAQLASNCVVSGWDGKKLMLRVDPACSSLIDSLAQQRLHEAIEAGLGRPLALAIEAGTAEAETPAQRQAREAQVRQQETEAEIANDPLVLAMQETFDAEIVPDSIRRID